MDISSLNEHCRICTTGIVDINSIDSDNIEAIYDAAGRAVSEMTEGIYILKVREGDRVVTKKVRK